MSALCGEGQGARACMSCGVGSGSGFHGACVALQLHLTTAGQPTLAHRQACLELCLISWSPAPSMHVQEASDKELCMYSTPQPCMSGPLISRPLAASWLLK